MSQDVEKSFNLWIENADNSLLEELKSLNEEEKLEAFGTSLSFGTAGLRGFLRAGTNGMNIHTVAQATQGLANYLKKNFKNPSVAIARDSRNKGWDFVKVCVGVLAANGITAYYSDKIQSTPGLSFSVRELHCSAGICVTASHNPAAYNGYKVYGPDGCQITTKAAADISSEINKIDMFEDVSFLNFDDAKDSDYAKLISDDVRQKFLIAAANCSSVPYSSNKLAGLEIDESDSEKYLQWKSANDCAEKLNIVYTALHGTGYPEVGPVLVANNFNITCVEEQIEPNGDFPTASYPNPEMADALKLGLEYCEKNNADILLATDPDADRVGVAVKHNGEYTRLNGNEIGILLFNYLCEARKAKGDDLSKLVMVTTIVSSDLINEIAKHYQVEMRRTLTGFKYIGEQILHLEQDEEKERYMFGFEESCGYLPGTHVRDKDGISTCLLIAQMAASYKEQGCDLVEVLDSLYKKFGYFKNDQISVEYPGLEGKDKMEKVLSGIRENKPTEFASLKVVSSKDYNEDTKMMVIGTSDKQPDELLPKSNVLEFSLEDGSKFIVRPSGTEPKIKVYCFATAADEAGCMDVMDRLKSDAKKLLA